MIHFHFVSRWPVLAAGCLLLLSPVAAQAQDELKGAAAVKEKLEPLLKGKVLTLAATGKSAADEFHISISGFQSTVIDGVRTGGRDFLSMRDSAGGVLSLGSQDWVVAPSMERPGWLELLTGGEASMEAEWGENLSLASAGAVMDPKFQGRAKMDLSAEMKKLFAGEGYAEVRARRIKDGWQILATETNRGTTALEVEPSAAFPVRSLSTRTDDDATLFISIATGPAATKAWSGITLDKIYKLGVPIRVTQQSRLQWYKADKGETDIPNEELQKFTMALLRPFMGAVQSVAEDAKRPLPPAVKTVAEKLATLCPPSLAPGLEPPPVPPENPNAPPDKPDDPLPGDQPVTVPLHRLSSVMAMIDVEIEGKAHRFLVDTGASMSLISTGASKNPKTLIEGVMDTSQDLAGARTGAKRRTLDSIRIGTWKLKDVDFMESDVGPRVHGTCSGVIGCDVLSQHPFTLDWQARTLTFFPRASFRAPAGAKETKLTLRSKLPCITATLSGWGNGTLPLMLDTANEGYLTLKEPADAAPLKGLRSWTSVTTVPSGLAILKAYAWPADRPLDLGFGSTPPVPFVDVSNAAIVDDYPNVAGTGVLRHFRLTFDFAGGKLWAEPAPDKYTPPASINEPDAFGVLPITHAVRTGDSAAIDALLKAGAVISGDEKEHPAARAANRGEVALAIRLLEHDKDATWKKSLVLYSAVQTGQIELVEWLLSHGADKTSSPDAMLYAATQGDVESGRRLRAAGFGFADGGYHAGVAAITKDKTDFLAWMLKEEPSLAKATVRVTGGEDAESTLLHGAAITGSPECVKILLAAGADPLLAETRDFHEPALIPAALKGRIEILRLLLAAVPGGNLKNVPPEKLPVTRAIVQPECLQALLDAGASPESGLGDVTPLVQTAKYGYSQPEPDKRAALAKSAEILIRAGAGLKAAVKSNNTGASFDLVDMFAGGGMVEPLKLVLAKGLSPEGLTGALSVAAQTGEIETLRILLAAGADPARPNKLEFTPLFMAIISGQTACVRELLLTKKVDVKEVVVEGNTLTHFAAKFNDPYLLQLLADAGAPLDTRNDAGATPLHEAIERRALLAVRFLLARGVKVNGAIAEFSEKLTPKYAALQEAVKTAAVSGKGKEKKADSPRKEKQRKK
ncbi:MAG TPA: ankyrin repeat domain-containing protein [Verrucomicrobiales bacterium]|nr:ankyrin repeat domain-containing protein [Verrucomicrobiales bacterium]